MISIEQNLKNKIDAVEPFSREELEVAKSKLIRDGDTLMTIHQRIAEEFSFLVEASIIEGVQGNIEQSVLYHKLSFQCLQINGMLMECARGEKTNEYYLTARKSG